MKRFFCLLLSTALFNTGTILPVHAQEGTSATQQSQASSRVVVLPRNETMNGDYLAAGRTVTVSGTVNGDAYLAGGTIIVEGTINGDVLAAGGTVMIRGTVAQNVRIVGGEVIVSGTVGRNVSVGAGSVSFTDTGKVNGSVAIGAGNVSLFSPIAKDVHVGAGQITIGNTIGGAVQAGVGQLQFTPSALVQGAVVYWSDTEAVVPGGTQLRSGITRHEQPQWRMRPDTADKVVKTGVQAWGAVKVVRWISTLVLGFLIVFLVPRYLRANSAVMRTRPLASVGIGVMTLPLVGLACVLLVLTIIGIPLAILLFTAFFVTAFIGTVVVAYTLGEWLMKYLGQKMAPGWTFVAGFFLLELITLVPVLGGITKIIVWLMALGAQILVQRDFFLTLRKKHLL